LNSWCLDGDVFGAIFEARGFGVSVLMKVSMAESMSGVCGCKGEKESGDDYRELHGWRIELVQMMWYGENDDAIGCLMS
jgi:hypothetical protein